MRYERFVRNHKPVDTTALTGTAAGATVGASYFVTKHAEVGTLSARVTLDAETNTVTLLAKWQVSDDATTWYDVYQPNSPANVIWATGTVGADAAVTRVLAAPMSVYGWRHARIGVEVGVAEAQAADTYAVGYYFARA